MCRWAGYPPDSLANTQTRVCSLSYSASGLKCLIAVFLCIVTPQSASVSSRCFDAALIYRRIREHWPTPVVKASDRLEPGPAPAGTTRGWVMALVIRGAQILNHPRARSEAYVLIYVDPRPCGGSAIKRARRPAGRQGN